MAGGMAVDGLDRATAETLERYGFGALPYDRLCAELRSGTASSNHVTGTVEVPLPGDITALPAMGTDARRELETAGLESMRRGEVGVVVLAGGMATRFGGVVKALAPAVDGHTFLELKVRDVAHVAGRAGATVPVYLMTSFATDERIREEAARLSSAATPIDCFAQFVSMRVTPNGELHRDVTGAASLYAPGHGDLPFALRRSHVLSRFRAAGGKYLFMSNVDNLAATLDPAVIGAHVAHGAAITVEVVQKEAGDAGGAPARVDGVLQIVEGFRFPPGFDAATIPVFNTNTFVFTAADIDRDFELSWFTVKKKVDGSEVVQFERLVGELTAFLPMRALRVERHGPDARFQPAKDPEELAARRDEIRAILRARGALNA